MRRPLASLLLLGTVACANGGPSATSSGVVEELGGLVCEASEARLIAMERAPTLPPWQLPSSAAEEGHAPCKAGDPSRVLIKDRRRTVVDTSAVALTRSDWSVHLEEQDRRVVPLRRVAADARRVALVPCSGEPLVLDRKGLEDEMRYVLVANRKNELKLVDRGPDGQRFKRVIKRIVAVERRR